MSINLLAKRQPRCVAEHRAVIDAEGLDPALLAERVRPMACQELDQFGDAVK